MQAAQLPAQKRRQSPERRLHDVIDAFGRSDLLANLRFLVPDEAILILRLHQQTMLRVKRGLPSITVLSVPREHPSAITSCECILHGRGNDAVSAPAQLPRDRVGLWPRTCTSLFLKHCQSTAMRLPRHMPVLQPRQLIRLPSSIPPVSSPQPCYED